MHGEFKLSTTNLNFTLHVRFVNFNNPFAECRQRMALRVGFVGRIEAGNELRLVPKFNCFTVTKCAGPRLEVNFT